MLKFPNIRLFLYHELLRQNKACATAMIDLSYALGIVPPQSLEESRTIQSDSACGAVEAGRDILRAALAAKGKFPGAEHPRFDELWRTVMDELARHSAESGVEHINGLGGLECGRMAPVVFDLVLQCLYKHD